MGNPAKFPSGLNNWVGTDKPDREDFVRDNAIVDEHAMWKAAYDPKAAPEDEAGPVEAAGGIPAYAMAKADYDADGTVAQAGGIGAAIEERVAFEAAELMHKADYVTDATAVIADGALVITSVYPREGDTYDVCFEVPAGYNEGMGVTIDNVVMDELVDLTGQTVDEEWAVGAPITLTRKGGRAFFKSGGRVRFRLVASQNRPATGLYRGLIWIPYTGIFTGIYIIGAIQPLARKDGTPLQAGDTWVQTSASSNVVLDISPSQLNAIEERINSVRIWNESEWVAYELAQVYNNGEWVGFRKYLYNRGINSTTWTVAEASASSGGGYSHSNTAAYYQIAASTTFGFTTYRVNMAVPAAGYNTLTIIYTCSLSGGGSEYSGITSSGTAIGANAGHGSLPVASAETTRTYNVSANNTTYLQFYCYCPWNNGAVTIRIMEAYLS